MTSNINGDGQKHCKCKKTHCLKLCCECFGAGLYCDQTCSCQKCFNRPDYEDTVDETRQRIELRNPLAFSPEIVEDRGQLKPIEGEHRKCCNCRKSMCMKKYCECYQANVGCSDGCRCEGCKNVFGKRGEHNVYNEADHETFRQPTGSDFSPPPFHNPHNLTPNTPFQHLGMISNSNNDDGQKRCNCRKSKCLKLYCECFASGLYCDEACYCKDCFNTPDYEDTVDETRRQIELRNPLAFSPKIHCLTLAPITQTKDGDQPAKIAGKHKKGCNCKRSMCVKKYCECYQANVGCSSECRCEGCKNVFGKKGDNDVHNELVPWSPFQHSGHEDDASTSAIFSGCYIPSQGSTNCGMMLETRNVNFDMVHSDQQSCTNVESLNEFTPPFMDLPNSTRGGEDFSSMNAGSLVTTVALFDGPKDDEYKEKPNAHSMTSPLDGEE